MVWLLLDGAHGVPSITHKNDIGTNELLIDATFQTDMNDEKCVVEM